MPNFQNLDDLILRLRTEGFQKGTQQVSMLRKEINGLVGVQTKASKAGKQAANNTKAMGNAAKGAQAGFLGLSDTLDKTIKKVALWTIATSAIFGTLRAIREGTATIIEHDTQITGLRKVYSGAAEDIAGIRVEVLGLSKDMKSLTEDAFDAAVTVARTGRVRRDVITLTTNALIAQNIAELESADAVKFLNSAAIQFNEDADQTLRILDEWNELSNRTPASTRDLAAAVSVAGSVFKQSGASIQFLNANTAALVEITAKSGNVIGRAERTMAIFSKRTSTVTKLARIGIRVYDELLDTYRGIDTILTEIASKWDNLTDIQKANIAQAMAGARQQQFFLALMDNQDIVLRNLITQWNSFGSAVQENQMFLESIAKRIDGLVNALQRLAISLGEGGVGAMLKGIIESLTQMVNAMAEANAAMAITAAAAGFLAVALLPISTTIGAIGVSLGIFVSTLTILNELLGSSASRTRQAQEELDKYLKTSRDLTARSSEIESMVETLENLMEAGEEEKVSKVLLEISRMDVFGDLISGANTYEQSIKRLKEELGNLRKEAELAKVGAIQAEISVIESRKRAIFKTVRPTPGVKGGPTQTFTGLEFASEEDMRRHAELQRQLQFPRPPAAPGEGAPPIDGGETTGQRMRNLKDEADIMQMILDGRRKEDIILARIAQIQRQINEGLVSDTELQKLKNDKLREQIRLQDISIQQAKQWSNVFQAGLSGLIASGFEGEDAKAAMRSFTNQFGNMLSREVTKGMAESLVAGGASDILTGLTTGGISALISGGIGLLSNIIFGKSSDEERNISATEENTNQLRALNDNIRNLTSFMVNAPAGFVTPPAATSPLFGMQGSSGGGGNQSIQQLNIQPGAIVVQGNSNPADTADTIMRRLSDGYGSGAHAQTSYGEVL